LTKDNTLRTQALVCTHSVTFVDRAPYHTINLIKIDDEYRRSLIRIKATEDDVIIDFVNEIGRTVGLSNTVLLYERCFIVVEGPSEEIALPIIYKSLYKTTMLEDGIVLINLNTCSAWKSVLKILLTNRKGITYFLLDADCQVAGSSGYITNDALLELGCTPDFYDSHIEYIGGKEFEDAFTDYIITKALNADFPLESGKTWKTKDIKDIRILGEKFSDVLQQKVIKNCVTTLRCNAKKPNIAEAISKQCNKRKYVPEKILNVFEKARLTAGVR
jgi:predicted ATP-dependent endonuclease of OLD family